MLLSSRKFDWASVVCGCWPYAMLTKGNSRGWDAARLTGGCWRAGNEPVIGRKKLAVAPRSVAGLLGPDTRP